MPVLCPVSCFVPRSSSAELQIWNTSCFTIVSPFISKSQEAVVCFLFVKLLSRVRHTVVQLVEALRYKPEGRGFDSRWCHWNYYVEIKCRLQATDDFYCRSYCLLNMFRAPLCPSLGAREYYTSGCCLSYLVLGFQVVGLVWS